MRSTSLALRCAAVLLLLGTTAVARAQAPVGHIHLKEGVGQIGREDEWIDAVIGDNLFVNDSLRTGPASRLQALFRDASMLTLSENTLIVIDQQIYDPPNGVFDSAFRLFYGKVRAFVSDYYEAPNAMYHIETPTAVIGHRGTEFVLIHDEQSNVTEVIGISGTVVVHSILDRARRGVLVTAGEVSSIAKGRYPTPARKVDPESLRRYLDGFDMATTGSPEGLISGSELAEGGGVPPEDTAPVVIEQTSPGGGALTGGPTGSQFETAPDDRFENRPGGTIGDPQGPSGTTRARVEF